MGDNLFIKEIGRMTLAELFALVMESPEYLSDGYYGDFGRAIRARYEMLT